MVWATIGELQIKIEEDEDRLEEFNRLINERLYAQSLVQNLNSNLQMPWLPNQELFTDPDEDLAPTEICSEEETDYEDPDFSKIDFTEEINLDDIYNCDTE